MTDRELLYVTTIAQEGSLTRAAQKLYITQPALSHSLTGIERSLGQPLFRRESRGLVLTYAGERYCETAREILRMYGDLEQRLGEIGGLRRGRVLVGMTRFLSMELMPRVFPEYRRRYPGVELQLWEEPSGRLMEMLSTRQLDLGVMNLTGEEAEQMEADYDCRVLYRDPFVIAAARGDPIGRYARDGGGELPVLDPRYLAGRAFCAVVAGQRIRRVTDRVFRQAGVTPEIVFTSSSFETARRVACSGQGIAMLPRRYAALLSGGGEEADYYAVPEEYRALLLAAAVRSRESYLPAAAARLLELLEEVAYAPATP